LCVLPHSPGEIAIDCAGLGAHGIPRRSSTSAAEQTIIDIAREKQVKIIVVGKRGAGRAAGLLLGSIS